MKVLLVDDDLELVDVTAYALQRAGHNVLVATDGSQALHQWEAEQPDVVVLDIGLPKVGGLEVCHTIRENSATPVILLTGLTDEDHIIQGFRSGADDYVTKPFSPRVLNARIQAVWGRGAGRGDAPPTRELTLGNLVIDVDSHEVQGTNGVIRLTPIEFRLLHILLMNAGRVVSSTRLVEYGWNYEEGDASLLKTHMSHIRTKLDLSRTTGGDMESAPGVGSRLPR